MVKDMSLEVNRPEARAYTGVQQACGSGTATPLIAAGGRVRRG